ncbi:hypothetical protein GWI33_007537, partial [Rhynchophorus ferrugineus]
MGLACKLIFPLILVGVGYVYFILTKLPPVPTIPETYWGPGQPKPDDTTIRPFKIDIPDEVINRLKDRLANTLPFQTPLEDAKQHYGINANLLSSIVTYWRTKYDWKKRQTFLNQYPQFKTQIQ